LRRYSRSLGGATLGRGLLHFSPFDSVGGNIRTGTERRPHEIVPVQIERAIIPIVYPQKRLAKTSSFAGLPRLSCGG